MAFQRLRALNPNVRYIIAFQFLWSFAEAVWVTTLLPEFIFQIASKRNSLVGYVTGCRGLSQIIVAIPCGILVDKYGRRDRVLWLSVLVFLVAAGTMSWAVLAESLPVSFAGMAAMGLFAGILNPPMEALLADSLPHGERSGILSLRASAISAGNLAGPATACIMFAVWGDHWVLDVLRKVVIAVLVLEACGACFLLLTRDRFELGKASEVAQPSPEAPPIRQREVPSPCVGSDVPCEGSDDDEEEDPAAPLLADEEPRRCLLRRIPIPALVSLSDVAMALGSGMTVRFFPLFFAHDYHVSPIGVQCIFAANGVLLTILNSVNQKVSRRIGRVETILLTKVVGVLLLCYMGLATGDAWWAKIGTIAPVFVWRTALMNSTRGLSRSILMDKVPKAKRGRWAAVDSIGVFGWSGSAAIGGVLADRWDYRTTFLVTAGVQALGTAIIGLMYGRVRPERGCGPAEGKLNPTKPAVN
eukprot:TRINITY_DN44413_c0_g1_i1.p1 TRINITY_DN44413_c0_g1~~TRINITY_DN44413_c0_g1_i1.p1  ORF type:complete len:489 (+),score=109.75 TRINITY_DN44413_c0_g1_i1:53-1468(+)